jgi:LPPG:FO 2-phospho-L-lactate transferase
VIVGLGGGIGAARLWRALLDRVDPGELTLITNTGDDLWWYGLRVCPDLDTVLYALTGRQDTERGWGRRGETWRTRDALRELGEQPWFNVGDLDLATHLYRTGALRAGHRLSEITAELAAAAGLRARLLPMTDDEVETHVALACGRAVHYQEFYVRRQAADRVLGVEYRGAADAKPAPGVLEAIGAAERILLAPSNPLASIGPILAVPGVRDAVAAAAAPVLAVTPIVTGVPIGDPAEQRRADSRAALLDAVGLPNTARSAAELLRDLLDCFVLDSADGKNFDDTGLGMGVIAAPTLVDEQGRFPRDRRSGRDLVELLLTYPEEQG